MNTSKVEIKKSSLREYTRLIISFLFCLILLTVYQYFNLYLKGVIDSVLNVSFILAIVHHVGYSSLIAMILVGPFHFIERFKSGLGFRITYFALLFLLVIESALITYYSTTLVPFGANLLENTFQDIVRTIINSGGFDFTFFMVIIVLIVFFYFSYKFTKKYYHLISNMFPLTIVFFSIFVATLFTEGKPINENKTQYLATTIFINSTENIEYTENVEFPLLKDVIKEDELGNYFNFKTQKPNIVFVIVEGLGRNFVGESTDFGGYTPFLNSLTTQSLYWDNFLSNSGETNGVIPSILGSLPFGKSGFMELDEYPNKLTLLSILKNNDYHTSFFQGTNSSFGNLDNFLKSENIDLLIEQSHFEKNYKKQASNADGTSWGYPDKALFAKSLSIKRKENKPRLEVYMTFSNHEPFLSPNQEYYEEKVENILSKSNSSSRVKKIISTNKNIFASLMYSDEAIKEFLENYKKLPGYDNTIFIITGNYSLNSIPQESTLSRFKVPFLIYSPLLKESKKMSAVSSHLDVTPTLLSMLNKQYNMALPAKVAWMGSAIDMNVSYRSTKNIPLMRNKYEMKEYLSQDNFLSDGSIYKINEKLELAESVSTENTSIEEKFQKFKALNAYVVTKNKIIPDSLVIYTIEKEKFTDEEIVWINSQFNGKNYHKAYNTARQLAFDKEPEKALLLLRYILSEIPSHIDAKILQGRINAWAGDYDAAIVIFEDCLQTNESYDDIYSALLDVCFWADKNEKVLDLYERMIKNQINNPEILKKVERAYTALQKKGKKSNTIISNPNIEAFISTTH